MDNKQEIAVITTDGPTEDVSLPVDLWKIREVAAERATFSSYEDYHLARWVLKINDILKMR